MALSWRRENEDDVGVASVASGEIGFDGEREDSRGSNAVCGCAGRCRFMEKKALRSAFWIK
jgi:hypothetical protein